MFGGMGWMPGSSRVSESQGPGGQGWRSCGRGWWEQQVDSEAVTSWSWGVGRFPGEALNSGTGQPQAEGGLSRTTGAQALCLQ